MPAEWNELHLDALAEVLNVGAGAATVPLHRALGLASDLEVPASVVVPLPDGFEQLGESERSVIVIGGGLGGDLSGTLMLIADPEHARRLVVRARATSADCDDADADDMLGELGRSMFDAFSDAVARMTMLSVHVDQTIVVRDMLGAVMQEAVASGVADGDEVLMLHTTFHVVEAAACLTVACVPPPDSVRTLLAALGLGTPGRTRDDR